MKLWPLAWIAYLLAFTYASISLSSCAMEKEHILFHQHYPDYVEPI